MSHVVRALEVFDDGTGPALYAGGDFDEAGGVSVDGVARWDGLSWSAVGPGPGPGRVYDLAVFDDGGGSVLYAAGEFSGLGYIARWTGTGWTSVGGGLDGRATELEVFDGELYVAGEFSRAGDAGIPVLARWDGTSWHSVGSSSPGLRRQHAMAFDAQRGRTVLFGGATDARARDEIGETWEWDGQQWSRTATGGPSARVDHAMAWHDGRHTVVLVGGATGGVCLSDVWEWNGASWSELSAAPFAARRNHALAYDSHRDRLVLFGGRGATSTFGDTWEWDGTNWQEVAIGGPAPSPREGHAMAYDPVRQRVILQGGWSPTEGVLGDTWEWDGTSWTLAATGVARREHALVFDSTQGRTVLIGGGDEMGIAPETVLSWDGAAWTPSAEDAPGREWHAAAFDSARSRIVMMGGVGSGIQADTWEFDGSQWSTIGGPPNGEINDLALHDDGSGVRLYAGGWFTDIGGRATDRIASWDGTSWSPIPDGPNNEVRALQSFDDGSGPALFVGGRFSNVGGMTLPNLAKWQNGQWSSIGEVAAIVTTFAVHDDGAGAALYIGGGFAGIGGVPANRIARWDGSSITPLGVGGDGVECMASFDAGAGQHLFVGGGFGSIGGNDSVCIGEWGYPCTPPEILSQPADVAANFGSSISFTVVTRGTDPLTYQWSKDGVALEDGGSLFGAATPTLTIDPWSLNDAGAYTVTITNGLGSVESTPAALTIPYIPPSGPVTVTPIIVPPEAIDSAPDVTITEVLLPAIAPTGEVLVKASTQGPVGNGETVVWWDEGQTSVPIWPEDPAPVGVPGVEFYQADPFWPQDIGRDGRYAFSSLLGGPGVSSINNESIWIYDGSTPHLLGREGFPAPGFTDRLFIHSSPTVVRVLGTGDVIFWGRVSGDPDDAGGLWWWRPDVGVTHLIGAGLPASEGGLPVTQVDWRVKTAAPNKVAFTGRLGGRRTVWFGPVPSPQVIVQDGDPAPGVAAGLTLEVMDLQLGAGGDLLLDVRLRDVGGNFAGNALYHWNHTGLALVAGPDDAAVGAEPGRTFFYPQAMAADSHGRFVFHSVIGGVDCSTCSEEGMWHVDEEGEISAIYLDGWPMPENVPDVFTSIDLDGPAALNDHGQLIFRAALLGPGVGGNALFGWTERHGVFPIAIPGTQFEVSPGEFRTMSSAYIPSEYLDAGGPLGSRSLTDTGAFAFRAGFTNDTRAILSGQFRDFLGAYFPCAAVVDGPHDTDATIGGSATLEVTAGGEEPIEYQWRKDESVLVDDGRITGSQTGQLTISDIGPQDAGAYDVIVTNHCGNEMSSAAIVRVFCPADTDRSGAVDVFDLLSFLDGWFSGSGDYDNNGATDLSDLLAYLDVWFSPC